MVAGEDQLPVKISQLRSQVFEVIMKKLLIPTLLVLGFVPLIYSTVSEPDCTYVNGEVTDTGTCKIPAEKLVIKMYKLGVCTSLPSAPTTSAAPDFSSCQTIFENTSGSDVTINGEVGSGLTGTFTRPLNGTYSYGYVIVAPQIGIQQSVKFNSSRTVTGGASSGVYCWSKAGTLWRKNGYNSAYVECGSSVASNIGVTETAYNSWNGTGAFSDTQTVPADPATGFPDIYSFLVGDDLKLKSDPSSTTSFGSISRHIGIAGPVNNPFVISDSTTSIDIGFFTSRGAKIKFDGSGNIENIKDGGLFYKLTVK